MIKSMRVGYAQEKEVPVCWAGKSSGQAWRYFGTSGITAKRPNQRHTGLQWSSSAIMTPPSLYDAFVHCELSLLRV